MTVKLIILVSITQIDYLSVYEGKTEFSGPFFFNVQSISWDQWNRINVDKNMVSQHVFVKIFRGLVIIKYFESYKIYVEMYTQ